MVRATTSGQMVASIKVIGSKTICTAKVCILGSTGESMKVSIVMTKSTDMVPTLGPMDASIRVNGNRERSMV